MKRLTRSLIVSLMLAFSSVPIALAIDDWDGWAGEPYWADEDFEVFESDNWLDDDYGVYDRDFDYDVIEDDLDAYDAWYEDPHYDWLGYDDAGEEGLFDI